MTIDEILNEMAASLANCAIATTYRDLVRQVLIIHEARYLGPLSDETWNFIDKAYRSIKANEPIRFPEGTDKHKVELFLQVDEYPEPYASTLKEIKEPLFRRFSGCLGVPGPEILWRHKSEWQFQLKSEFRRSELESVRAKMKPHPQSKNSLRKKKSITSAPPPQEA